MGRNEHIDLEGNRVSEVWFEAETDCFEIDVNMQVETLRRNAFDFILAPESVVLAIRHAQDVACAQSYLPGAGSRGFDPTHGEAVADTHVTVAAAAHPRDTMPVTGSFRGERVTSSLDFTVEVHVSGGLVRAA